MLWALLLATGKGHGRGQVLLSDRGPGEWVNMSWQKTFWSGRLLRSKARILHFALHDTSKYEFSGNTPADWCVGLRVPGEWVRHGGHGWWTVQPEQMPAEEVNLDLRLFAAVDNNDAICVRELIEQHADPNTRNRTGWQPLLMAATAGYVACARELVHHRADVNSKNSFGGRPLGLAVVRGHVAMLRELVKARADLNEQDSWGETPLHLAAKNGFFEAVDELIGFRADVWARNIYGDLPYDLCKARGFKGLADTLQSRMDHQDHGVELPYPLQRDAAQLTALTAPKPYF